MWVSVAMQKAGWTTEASNRYYYWHDQHVIGLESELRLLRAEHKQLQAEKALVDSVNGWVPDKRTLEAYERVTGESKESETLPQN